MPGVLTDFVAISKEFMAFFREGLLTRIFIKYIHIPNFFKIGAMISVLNFPEKIHTYTRTYTYNNVRWPAKVDTAGRSRDACLCRPCGTAHCG